MTPLTERDSPADSFCVFKEKPPRAKRKRTALGRGGEEWAGSGEGTTFVPGRDVSGRGKRERGCFPSGEAAKPFGYSFCLHKKKGKGRLKNTLAEKRDTGEPLKGRYRPPSKAAKPLAQTGVEDYLKGLDPLDPTSEGRKGGTTKKEKGGLRREKEKDQNIFKTTL